MMKKFVCLCVIVVMLIPVSFSCIPLGSSIVVGNGKVYFEFSSKNYNLTKIVDVKKGEEINFLDSVLWRVVLVDTTKIDKILTNEPFLKISSDDSDLIRDYSLTQSSNGEILQLTWERGDYGRVVVKIELPKDSYLSTWNIYVEERSKRYALWYIDFPYLRIKPIKNEKETNLLALPVNGGAIVENPFDNIHWVVNPYDEVKTDLWRENWIDTRGSYPGNYNAQFAALYSKEGLGLYLASYDGSMYSKRFLFNGDGKTLAASIRNYPEHMLTPGVNYNIPYEFKLGIFHGDWMNASDIYKEWAKNQIWCKKGPMYEWSDLSKSAYDIDLTTIAVYRITLDTPIHYQKIRDDLLAMKEFFDRYASVKTSTPKIGVHWIGWSKYLDVVNSNSGFPNYLPPQEKFVSLIDELHSKGSFYNDVYLTLHGSDMNTPYKEDDRYAWRDYKEYACYNPLGEVYRRFTPHTAWMDPSEKGWQDIEIQVSEEAKRTCHLDGMYYDWYPKFRLDFKHHKGGGNYFAKGYREEMKRIKEVIRKRNPNFYCCPEGKSEIEVGVFDAMLMEWFHSDEKGVIRSFANIGMPIPLISYLYHEYIGMAGGIRVKNKDFSGFRNPSGFKLISGIIWVWGNKPQYPFVDGRKSDSYVFTQWKEGKLDPVWEENLIYLANLVKMYRIGKKAMFFGKMLRPPKLKGPNEMKTMFNDQMITIPSVLINAFESPDGDVYLPITNWQATEERIDRIDFSECDWLSDTYELQFMDDKSTYSLGKFNGKIANINLNVKPETACFLIVKSKG